MNNDIINFQKSLNTQPQNNYQPTRAKSYKVIAPIENYAQYIRTIKAYALAGLPFEHIANAGDLLGDKIEKGEVDAPVEVNSQEKVGEIVEDESKILAWQNRGERILVTKQLSQPIPTSGNELISQSQNLTVNNTSSPQSLNVLEGIAVYNQQPQGLSNSTASNSQLENNPYLKAPPIMNKS